MIRKGVLTPFYKLEGFERRLQQPGPSNGCNGPEEAGDGDDSATAVAKFMSSVSAVAQARPATKLLDAEFLPKLDPPTRPFHRLQKRANLSGKSGREMHDKSQGSGIKKRKRPLPGKRWRKDISCEERHLEADGMHLKPFSWLNFVSRDIVFLYRTDKIMITRAIFSRPLCF